MKDFKTIDGTNDPLFDAIAEKNSSIEGKDRYRISNKLKSSSKVAEYLRDVLGNTELYCTLSSRKYLKVTWVVDGELYVAGFYIVGISYMSDNKLEYIVEKIRELSGLPTENPNYKGWDWAQKWLLEGKAVIRRCHFDPNSKPSGYLNSRPDSIHAIWWNPSDNDLKNSYPRSLEERSGSDYELFALATLHGEDFAAKDWMIYPHHQSESDAWIDGDLDTEVELGSKLDAYWKNMSDIDMACMPDADEDLWK